MSHYPKWDEIPHTPQRVRCEHCKGSTKCGDLCCGYVIREDYYGDRKPLMGDGVCGTCGGKGYTE